MPPVARFGRLTRRAGPVGVALTVWDLWRRLPPKQRRQIAQQVRKHGPTVARRVAQARRNRKR
jgi:hypothetical protein